jgi:hypothetical protein
MYVCRALALTIEELRALLALVLGTSDLVLLFTLRALADEQLTGDKASLNLQVLRKQVRHPELCCVRTTPDLWGLESLTPECPMSNPHVAAPFLVQALGQQSEYMRATTATGSQGGASSANDGRAEVSKLIADKQQLQKELDQAKADAAAAAKNLAAVKTQAQVRVAGGVRCVLCAVVQQGQAADSDLVCCLLPAPAGSREGIRSATVRARRLAKEAVTDGRAAVLWCGRWTRQEECLSGVLGLTRRVLREWGLSLSCQPVAQPTAGLNFLWFQQVWAPACHKL